MKIMVFDVPAEHGGALTILNLFYEKACNDLEKEWLFIVSTPTLKQRENIKVLRFPWVKKSWFHRLYFDKIYAKRLICKYRPDEILSLQSVLIPNVNINQTLYLQQSLPFAGKRFSIREDCKIWVYQNVVGRMIIKSVKKADKVIVQTKWIRDAVINKTGADQDKFIIEQPAFNIKVTNPYMPAKEKATLFFYPANGLIYKNHDVLVRASRKLKLQGFGGYRVLFTLVGDENRHIKSLYKQIEKEQLPIEFIGLLPLEAVYSYYAKSILVFSSYVETVGLPLLEAKAHGTEIISSDCPFSREVLSGYKRVRYFDPDDYIKLAMLMKHSLAIN